MKHDIADIADIVVVGGGLAAAKAAETVRAEGFDGHVTLITEEPEPPYERPPLSKGALTGDKPFTDVYVHPPSFYDDHAIDLLTGDPATAIQRDHGFVRTRSGRRVAFDRLLLATGAEPHQLGATALDGVVTLRTLADARLLQKRLIDVGHVTVVGAGWIGSEVAASARTLGAEVTLVDPHDVPLQRVLGTEIGGVFAGLHRDHGVDLHTGVHVTGLDGSDHVEAVTLSDDTRLDTELVVVGIGVTPRTELAADAGLDVDDGILVDATLTTSDPRILAAGDVANAWHPTHGTRLRVEHWANALNQGKTAGRNLLGADETYDRLPYFFSDQYDLGMEYVGHATHRDQIVVRGDLNQRAFIAFWLHERRVIAATNVNIWDVVEDLKALIHTAQPVDPARLADPDTALTDLAGPSSA